MKKLVMNRTTRLIAEGILSALVFPINITIVLATLVAIPFIALALVLGYFFLYALKSSRVRIRRVNDGGRRIRVKVRLK